MRERNEPVRIRPDDDIDDDDDGDGDDDDDDDDDEEEDEDDDDDDEEEEEDEDEDDHDRTTMASKENIRNEYDYSSRGGGHTSTVCKGGETFSATQLRDQHSRK